MTGVQDMLNKDIFTKSLTFILYYAWQRNTKYVVRVMCVLHAIFFMHLSDCKAASVVSDIWLQVRNRPFNLQLVIRHIIIQVIHCVQVGEQEIYSKKTKKDWHHFKWYPSLFFVCLFVFPVPVSLLRFSNADLYHLKRELISEKRFWVTHVILYSCQLYYPILKANCLCKGTGDLAILIWWRQGRGID